MLPRPPMWLITHLVSCSERPLTIRTKNWMSGVQRTSNVKLGIASDFNIAARAKDAFRRSLPYSSPPLKTDQEFIALKAKPRPVILIQPPDPSLLAVKKGNYGGKVVRHPCPVVLV